MRLSPPHARSRRCQHARALAVERVLFGGWGRTHTRWAGRPSSPVIGAAAFTPHRLNVGVSRRKPPRVMHDCPTCRSAVSMLDASSPRRVASCAALRQRRTSRPRSARGLRFQIHHARGRASALGPRLDEPGSSEPCVTRLGGCTFLPSRKRQPAKGVCRVTDSLLGAGTLRASFGGFDLEHPPRPRATHSL